MFGNISVDIIKQPHHTDRHICVRVSLWMNNINYMEKTWMDMIVVYHLYINAEYLIEMLMWLNFIFDWICKKHYLKRHEKHYYIYMRWILNSKASVFMPTTLIYSPYFLWLCITICGKLCAYHFFFCHIIYTHIKVILVQLIK